MTNKSSVVLSDDKQEELSSQFNYYVYYTSAWLGNQSLDWGPLWPTKCNCYDVFGQPMVMLK